LPTETPHRDITLEPFEAPTLRTDIKRVHSPNESKLWVALIFTFFSLIFLGASFLRYERLYALLCSLMTWSYAVAIVVCIKWRAPPPESSDQLPTETPTDKADLTDKRRPSDLFIGSSGTDSSSAAVRESEAVISAQYKQFELADRATAHVGPIRRDLVELQNVDQRASRSLQLLNLTPATFVQYKDNLKTFIARNIIMKLELNLQSDDPMIKLMLEVPDYAHCQQYVKQRIRGLATPHLGTHQADRGDRFEDREWSHEFPSDNQIVLHILTAWLSHRMTASKPGARCPLVFKERFISIGKERKPEKEDDIILCSSPPPPGTLQGEGAQRDANMQKESWKEFYVFTKFKKEQPAKTPADQTVPEQSEQMRFWAPPGRDSMYGALTLFFYFVGKKLDNLIDAADLQDPSCGLHRIFTSVRLDDI
jgi:hypothetical protein